MANKIDVAIIKREGSSLNIKFVKDFEDTLTNLYDVIDCRAIDIITRTIKGRTLDFVVDDEYLLKTTGNEWPTGLLQSNPQLEQIYGVIIITGTADREGNLTSLSKLDFKAIKDSVLMAMSGPKDKEHLTGENLDIYQCFDVITYGI